MKDLPSPLKLSYHPNNNKKKTIVNMSGNGMFRISILNGIITSCMQYATNGIQFFKK